jgi:threonine synthase
VIPLELIREFEMQMKALRIGDTPTTRVQRLEKRLGVRRLHLKLEGENPTGTHKDRMALLLALDARKKGLDTLAATTCSNYGAALAYVCEKLNMKCKIYIPADFHASRRPDIEAMGGEVTLVKGDYEATMKVCADDALRNHWYNANPGGSSRELGVYSYTFISREIAQALGRSPDWVSVPVGNGTVIGGVWQGFRGMGMKPRVLGCSNNNSAVRAVLSKSRAPVFVPDLHITEVNEPLSGNFLADPEEAISAMLDSNGAASEITDEDMVKMSKTIKQEEGLDILPAAAAALAGIAAMDSKSHTYVAVLTSRDTRH